MFNPQRKQIQGEHEHNHIHAISCRPCRICSHIGCHQLPPIATDCHRLPPLSHVLSHRLSLLSPLSLLSHRPPPLSHVLSHRLPLLSHMLSLLSRRLPRMLSPLPHMLSPLRLFAVITTYVPIYLAGIKGRSQCSLDMFCNEICLI
jgi:hypothetical protein